MSGGVAAPSDLTAAQVAAALPVMFGDTGTGGTKGQVPAPAAGDAVANRFLKADGTWATTPAAPVTSVHGRTGVVAAANGDYTASQVTNVAAGTVAATTVQAAINELDTEKLGATAAAGGDLSGTYPNPAVAKLQGRTVDSAAPVNGQVLKWDGGTTSWKPAVVETFVTLADGNATPDASSGNTFLWTLTTNRTLNAPTNLAVGQRINLMVQQDATGGRSVTFAAGYKWSGGTVPQVSAAANAIDVITVVNLGGGVFLCAIVQDIR